MKQPLAQADIKSQSQVWEVWTDGACSHNPGPGGWAAVLKTPTHSFQLTGNEAHTTNNRMELLATIKALQAIPVGVKVKLHSDSQYMLLGITKWLKLWRAKNWRKADDKPLANKDLWMQLDELAKERKIAWHWVKGHADNPNNQICDKLAKAEILRYKPTKPDNEL